MEQFIQHGAQWGLWVGLLTSIVILSIALSQEDVRKEGFSTVAFGCCAAAALICTLTTAAGFAVAFLIGLPMKFLGAL
ncbi:hypothetical protein EOD42_23295 [Rhodovarius crocodyli]|uniref:Uncharacterized protein n=1 Tax=Rhodovarius crocodyli TaxID=1979269 RepID=A0A437LZ96_9PROT|nr:hypothetical protein [Rhodovarius crocodyli]RVT90730.1 hypothetical protein EOD42_23295 [Rhodovarius crocodyli]